MIIRSKLGSNFKFISKVYYVYKPHGRRVQGRLSDGAYLSHSLSGCYIYPFIRESDIDAGISLVNKHLILIKTLIIFKIN